MELRGKARGLLKTSLGAFLSKKPPEDIGARAEWVRALGTWPFSLVEKKLVAFLDDPAADVKLAACELLIRQSAKTHREKILAALAGCRCEDQLQQARVAVIRLRLGEKKALQEVREWAALQSARAKLQEEAHWCPMHPRILKANAGKCPICRMPLVQTQGELDLFSHLAEVSLLALDPLAARNDPVVPQTARRILVSNAHASERMWAAVCWARVAPREAEPHLRLFLTTGGVQRANAVSSIANGVPEPFLSELKGIAADDNESARVRLWAVAGILKPGQRRYLEVARRFAALKPTKDNAFVRAEAIADFGTREDVERIAGHLDGELGQMAASSLLRLLDRLSE